MGNKNKLTGIAPSIYDLNMAFYGTGDPDLPNMNSEEFKKMWECATPKTNKKIIGKVIITSTAMSDKRSWFKEIWESTKK